MVLRQKGLEVPVLQHKHTLQITTFYIQCFLYQLLVDLLVHLGLFFT